MVHHGKIALGEVGPNGMSRHFMVERPPMVGVVRLVEYDEGLDPRIELSKPYSLDLRIPNSELRFENRVPDDLIDDAVAESLIGRGLEIVRQALGHSL